MSLLITVLIILVGIEHLGIMVLEIWGRPEFQAQAFGMPLEFVRQAAAQTALANQGIYNGMLGGTLLASQWLLNGQARLTTSALLLIFVIIVAIFGSLTVKRSIFWLQGMPSIVTLIVLLMIIA
ncbi:DUF1304 domain-containing protein [Levilactobacillus tangyuanensis]|uniref:DUF1304 domain-containing protein n=1 Tax=Levilactobacillus tangyuanensis TaxID=2486021 RepID=A0ABW1TMC6_9LACO|nr:DUF1304 domain-containing protein [Levilactobacillus tangyuanensis]